MGSTNRPAHYGDEAGTWFKNPWDVLNDEDRIESNSWFNLTNLPTLRTLAGLEFPLQWARDYSGHILRPVKVVKPDFGRGKSNTGNIKATWLGHAGFLVEFGTSSDTETPIRILFDPFLSERAGPSQWASIPRRLPAPCSVEELPDVHYVLISHNHHDHLDTSAVNDLARLRGSSVYFFVPKGVKSMLTSSGVPNDQVLEMDWWEEMSLPIRGGNDKSPFSVKFCCVPSQHNSGRAVWDQNASLWCGWVVQQTHKQRKTVTVYHAGDTGYTTTRGPCPAFKEIGERYGPMDLSMIPIWRGGSLSFIARFGLRLGHIPYLSALHATPAHAFAVHHDVRSRHSLAMHFGTLAGSDTEAVEPLVELEEAKVQKGGVDGTSAAVGKGGADWETEGGFGWVDVGETAVVSVF